MIDIDLVRKEVLSIRSDGKVTAAEIIDWAWKNPASETYKWFEWDTEKAAYKWWQEQAGQLIRKIEIHSVVESRTITTVSIAWFR